MVKPETIMKCFRKSGVLDSSMDVVIRDEEDPFLEADGQVGLQGLIDEAMSDQACWKSTLMVTMIFQYANDLSWTLTLGMQHSYLTLEAMKIKMTKSQKKNLM